MTTEVHPTAKEIAEAMYRIALTPDGAALYVLLQRKLMTVSSATSDGALYDERGERKFAATLIGLMAKGMHERGGRTGISGSNIGPGGIEQPVIVPGREPVNTGSRTPGRRVTADTVVPGWNDHPTD